MVGTSNKSVPVAWPLTWFRKRFRGMTMDMPSDGRKNGGLLGFNYEKLWFNGV